uniref:Pre-mRNA-splicing factor SPF27 n=1 Tax=Chlamydomonas euryale TaxID=1486919 RepID=A0A7R9VI47_9CHLO|mmetsp:Transcript_34704/g.102991  ORF Transcript_34704/g.102991 Transcript_34704/m.102991 type:complete len:244 (+) Transcript_34704:206-937(+)
MAAKTAPKVLAIEGAGGSSGFSAWRKDEHLVDALPYVDGLTPQAKRIVDELIDAEVRRSTKRPADYLREMPPLPASRLEGHAMLEAEYERVKTKQPMAQLDTTRYRLDAPQGTKRHDFGAWRAAADNAHAQLEHQYLRIANLELLLRHGDKTWRAQGQLVDSLVSQFKSQLAELQAAVAAVNSERKLQQTAAGGELRRAEMTYYEMVHKNLQIEVACNKLEAEVAALREAHPDAAAAWDSAQQ